MLLSDRDIRAGIDAGTIVLDPWDPQMVQPASVDVRLDRYFRLFDNHRYPSIDPSQEQPELTHLIETAPDEAFILHPGEFVLAATYEQVTLGNGIAARLEGKSSLGRLGLLTHSTAGFIDPGFQARDPRTFERGNATDQTVARYEDRAAVLFPALVGCRSAVRIKAVPVAVFWPAWPDRIPIVSKFQHRRCFAAHRWCPRRLVASHHAHPRIHC